MLISRKYFDKKELPTAPVLSHFKDIVNLSLKNCFLNFRDEEQHPSFNQLQSLSLNKCQFDGHFMQSVLESKTCLQELSICNYHQSDMHESKFFEMLAEFNNLSLLTLIPNEYGKRNHPIRWEGISKLRELTLSGIEDFAEVFPENKSPSLEKLHLIECVFDEKNTLSLNAWGYIARTAPIRELVLENCTYSDKYPLSLLEMKQLKHLTLSGGISEFLFSQVAKVENLVELRLVDIENSLNWNNISNLKALTTLQISAPFKHPPEFFDISSFNLDFLKSLELDLISCDLSYICSPFLKNFEKLSLKRIRPIDSSFLMRISTLTNLKLLHLECCTIKDMPLAVFISYIPRSVEEISLYKTILPTYEFFQLLVAHLPLLRRIKFETNGMSSKNIRPLRQANMLEVVELVRPFLDKPNDLLKTLASFGIQVETSLPQ